MSVKLGDIDLNSDLVPVETNSNLNGCTLVESIMGNSAADDHALMDQSTGGHGGSLIDGGVEEIRGFQQAESVINNGGIETNDPLGSKDFDGGAVEKAVTDFGLKDNGCISFEAGNSDYGDGKNEDTFAHSEEENNMFTLVVDLNMHHGANGETKSNDDESVRETCNKRFTIDNNGCNNNARVNEDIQIEKEGEFEVSDLVWGKVPSHPWWPGQIYDRSAASKTALRYKKNDGFLIAYFGDESFAWNDASTIKPFRMYFSDMHKQSNTESFTNAVSCALEELSRRVEYGLSCRCLPKQVYSKIESQVNVNSGIRKESRARVGGDNFSAVASFGTSKFVDYLKDLAQDPFGVIDRLELITTKAQLLAFNHWKGYAYLPKFTILNGLLDDDLPIVGNDRDPKELIGYGVESKDQVSYEKGKSVILDNTSRKHKLVMGDCGRPRKREKCMSCPDDDNNLEENGESGGNTPMSPVTASKTVLSEKLFKVGDRIRKVANQLSGPTSIFKHNERKSNSQDEDRKAAKVANGVLCPNAERECPPSQMLSQLSIVAVDPMKGKIIQSKNSLAKVSHDVEANKSFGDCEKQSEGGSEKEMSSFETKATVPNSTTAPSCNNLEPEAEKTVGHANEELENHPTVLVLNFNDFKSIPSEEKLNTIFSAFGPLMESYTEVLKKHNRAKVVFKRRVDAEKAFSSAGKFSTFGPSLISYRLNYKISPRKPSTSVTKRKRKDATPVKVKESVSDGTTGSDVQF